MLSAGDPLEDARSRLRCRHRRRRTTRSAATWVGVIRRDLRDRPMVVQPGGLVVVETPSRATAGAHYTPRSLAEEVVLHALEPLVFHPGPHDTADRDAWRAAVLRSAPRPQGRRHRLRLRRIPGRRRPISRRPAHRSMAPRRRGARIDRTTCKSAQSARSSPTASTAPTSTAWPSRCASSLCGSCRWTPSCRSPSWMTRCCTATRCSD